MAEGHNEATMLANADTILVNASKKHKRGELPRVKSIQRVFDTFEEIYEAITQAYFQDDEAEFGNTDINDHPLLKLVAFILDDAIQISEAEFTPINTFMVNVLDYEINTLKRMQRLFK